MRGIILAVVLRSFSRIRNIDIQAVILLILAQKAVPQCVIRLQLVCNGRKERKEILLIPLLRFAQGEQRHKGKYYR